MEATQLEQSPATVDLSPQEWFEACYLCTKKRGQNIYKFGNLPLHPYQGTLADCCGNIHLKKGMCKTTDSDAVSFDEAAKYGKTLYERYDNCAYTAYLIENQHGIYSGEFMTGEELRTMVGIPDAEFLELVDDDGSVYSFAWKDE
jgi:hypothetical protein